MAPSYMPCHLGCSDMGVAAQSLTQSAARMSEVACAVTLDGQRLTMVGSEHVQEHSLPLVRGSLRITWELHRPSYGNTISIQTGEAGCTS